MDYKEIEKLVIREKSGDTSALVALAAYYKPLFRASVNKAIRRFPVLSPYKEDLEQDCVVVLHDIIKSYDASLSYFSYYLSNLFLHLLTAKAQHTHLGRHTLGQGIEEICFSQLPVDWEPETNDDPMGRRERVESIQLALDKLNSNQREAVQLYFFEKKTQIEAAFLLGITQSSFSKRLQRALEKLKIIFSDELNI